MATATAKQAENSYLICGPEGEWYITEPVKAPHAEEAVEKYEKSEGNGDLSVGEKYRVYEVVGRPVDLETVPTLKRT